jgi:hypothetical protein
MRIYGSEYAARCDLFLRLFNLAIAISGIAIEPEAPRGLCFAPPVSSLLANSGTIVNSIVTITNWLALIYAAIPLAALLVAFLFYVSGKRISEANFAKVVEISKWYLVTVSIVFAAKIIESGFTERETGIKEMQLYDKYVAKILEADNIESRWKLAEYFSAVTPTERLRERWTEYKTLLKPDYDKFKSLEARENELLSEEKDRELAPEDQQELNKIQQQKASLDRSLVETSAGRHAVVFTSDREIGPAKSELEKLSRAGIKDAQLYFRKSRYRTVSLPFETRALAAQYLQVHKEKLRPDVYVVDLDKWCPNASYNKELRYFSCD